ncbi:unnamed protein product [Diabrotica balteata]|uniref:Uncharacterized protein n=1 Tax=Diabrotica balteata TaxID=107213 RepID=A0A9N9SZ56_DIABA|nr:unnamed protein product [Diabrotica balteata]
MVKNKKMKKVKEENESSDFSNVPYDDNSDMDTDQESDAECMFCTEHYSKEQHAEKWVQCSSYFKWSHEECAGSDKMNTNIIICDFCI